jgi:hypothetical protein
MTSYRGNPMMASRLIAFAACTGLMLAAAGAQVATAATLTTGVNLPNATRAGPADRAAVIAQLKTAGVRTVRFPFGTDPGDIAYAAQLYAQGIKVDMIVSPQYPPNAPTRPPYPEDPHMYPGHPLSSADPALSKVYYEALMARLDASGVVLESFELGNEINWSAFNDDIPLPGEGKIFGLEDLSRDPEGQQIARSFIRYLQILAALKEARDHSKLNRNTPIVSAGLSPTGRPRLTPGKKEDGVSIEATIQFLRANGLDKLVDGYGLHFYPWQRTTQETDMNLQNNVVAVCQPAGSGAGKPCWITEWGVVNPSAACPLDESPRLPLVEHMMDVFRGMARQGRIQAEFYYSWNTDPWTKREDPITVFRCGSVTQAGRVALTP